MIAAGVAVSVLGLCNLQTLTRSRDDFYNRARFADVFVSLKRAPLAIRSPERANVLKVSSGALFRHADGWAVYMLEEGQEIVVHPGDAVADGVRVVRR